MRADLEASAQTGLAILAFPKGGIPRVLPRCTLAGTYRFVHVVPKEDRVRITTRDELSAMLPFLHAAGRGGVGAALSDDREVDLAVVIRARSTASALAPNVQDLRGDCDGATHVVATILHGAFALASQSNRQGTFSADVLGLASKATTGDAALIAKSDGNPAACRSSSVAPTNCQSVVKVSLQTIAAAAPATDMRGASSWAHGTCGGDEACHRACNAGDMKACVSAGAWDAGAGRDDRAERLLRVACDAGVGHGCTMLAIQYDPTARTGRGGADRERAIQLYARGCEMGSLDGCKSLAYYAQKKDPFRIDEEPLVQLASRACVNGDTSTCEVVSAWYYAKGVSLSHDRPTVEARRALEEALAWERRYCQAASAEELKRSPCQVENWEAQLHPKGRR